MSVQRRFKPYPAYKHSGAFLPRCDASRRRQVEWLGEIPAHWAIAPLKSLLRRCAYGISDSLTEIGDIRVLTMAHIQDGGVVLPEVGAVNQVDDPPVPG